MRSAIRRAAPMSVRVLVTAAAYYATAQAGFRVALVRGQITPLWLPAGVAIVCLLLFGGWTAIGIAIGTFLADLPLGPSPGAVAVIGVGDTLGPLCAYWLLRRSGFHLELDRLGDAVTLAVLGVFPGTLISATIGTVVLWAENAVSRGQFWEVWSMWWSGDAVGVLVGAPFLLALRAVRPALRRVPSPGRWVEPALLVCGTLAVAFAVTRNPYHLLFLVFPLLIWAALRFEHVGAATCVLIVAVVAAAAAANGYGPFAGSGVFSRIITLQTFNGAAALTTLLLASAVKERNAARGELERVAADLTKMAIDLERGQRTMKSMVIDLVRAQRLPTRRDSDVR